MDRLDRFYRIQQLLKARRFVRTQDFLDELEVSRATFKRDLEYLRDRFRAPIVYDPDQRPTASTTRSRTAPSGSCPASGSRPTSSARSSPWTS